MLVGFAPNFWWGRKSFTSNPIPHRVGLLITQALHTICPNNCCFSRNLQSRVLRQRLAHEQANTHESRDKFKCELFGML